MKKRIAAGLMTAAMMMSAMAVPFSVSAEDAVAERTVVAEGILSTNAAAGMLYFDSLDFTHLHIIWNFTLYSDNDFVLTADTYQTPYDNEQTVMVHPAFNPSQDELILGAIGFNGDSSVAENLDIRSVNDGISLSEYERTNHGVLPEYESGYWDNKIEIAYGGGEYPATFTKAGRKKYGEHLIELTFHNWTAEEFCLAGHLLYLKEVLPDDTFPDGGYVFDELSADNPDTYTEKYFGKEKYFLETDGDRRIIDVYSWSSPENIYEPREIGIDTANGNYLLKQWEETGSFSYENVLYKDAVDYHFEVCSDNIIYVTAVLNRDVTLPENEESEYLLDFGEIYLEKQAHDTWNGNYSENALNMQIFCTEDKAKRTSDEMTFGRFQEHLATQKKTASAFEEEFSEKHMNDIAGCAGINTVFKSNTIQKDEVLFHCSVEPLNPMFRLPSDYCKRWGQEPLAPFYISIFGTTYKMEYLSGRIQVISSNMKSVFQDEDYAEVDRFTAPEYTSVAGEKPAVTVAGDADGSGAVDIIDVIAVNKAVLGKELLSEQGLVNADVNKNGIPDASDSLMIMKKIVGLIQNFD